jgi:phosphoserine aminotransferase
LEKLFIAEAEKNGLIELQGHESTGGLRVSMYNGMPIEGAKKLKDFMQEFLSKN